MLFQRLRALHCVGDKSSTYLVDGRGEVVAAGRSPTGEVSTSPSAASTYTHTHSDVTHDHTYCHTHSPLAAPVLSTSLVQLS